MDVDQDIVMQVCLVTKHGKTTERVYVGGSGGCEDYCLNAAERFAKEFWTVGHADDTGEWYFSKPGMPDFSLVIGDYDLPAFMAKELVEDMVA